MSSNRSRPITSPSGVSGDSRSNESFQKPGPKQSIPKTQFGAISSNYNEQGTNEPKLMIVTQNARRLKNISCTQKNDYDGVLSPTSPKSGKSKGSTKSNGSRRRNKFMVKRREFAVQKEPNRQGIADESNAADSPAELMQLYNHQSSSYVVKQQQHKINQKEVDSQDLSLLDDSQNQSSIQDNSLSKQSDEQRFIEMQPIQKSNTQTFNDSQYPNAFSPQKKSRQIVERKSTNKKSSQKKGRNNINFAHNSDNQQISILENNILKQNRLLENLISSPIKRERPPYAQYDANKGARGASRRASERRADQKTPYSINPIKSSKENSEKKKSNARKEALRSQREEYQDMVPDCRDFPLSSSQSARISPQKLENSSSLNMMKSQERIFQTDKSMANKQKLKLNKVKLNKSNKSLLKQYICQNPIGVDRKHLQQTQTVIYQAQDSNSLNILPSAGNQELGEDQDKQLNPSQSSPLMEESKDLNLQSKAHTERSPNLRSSQKKKTRKSSANKNSLRKTSTLDQYLKNKFGEDEKGIQKTESIKKIDKNQSVKKSSYSFTSKTKIASETSRKKLYHNHENAPYSGSSVQKSAKGSRLMGNKGKRDISEDSKSNGKNDKEIRFADDQNSIQNESVHSEIKDQDEDAEEAEDVDQAIEDALESSQNCNIHKNNVSKKEQTHRRKVSSIGEYRAGGTNVRGKTAQTSASHYESKDSNLNHSQSMNLNYDCSANACNSKTNKMQSGKQSLTNLYARNDAKKSTIGAYANKKLAFPSKNTNYESQKVIEQQLSNQRKSKKKLMSKTQNHSCSVNLDNIGSIKTTSGETLSKEQSIANAAQNSSKALVGIGTTQPLFQASTNTLTGNFGIRGSNSMGPFKTPKQVNGSSSFKKLFTFDNIFESNRSNKSNISSTHKGQKSSQSKKVQKELENIQEQMLDDDIITDQNQQKDQIDQKNEVEQTFFEQVNVEINNSAIKLRINEKNDKQKQGTSELTKYINELYDGVNRNHDKFVKMPRVDVGLRNFHKKRISDTNATYSQQLLTSEEQKNEIVEKQDKMYSTAAGKKQPTNTDHNATPTGKVVGHHAQKLSVSAQLLADRRNRDRQKTQIRTYQQVRKTQTIQQEKYNNQLAELQLKTAPQAKKIGSRVEDSQEGGHHQKIVHSQLLYNNNQTARPGTSLKVQKQEKPTKPSSVVRKPQTQPKEANDIQSFRNKKKSIQYQNSQLLQDNKKVNLNQQMDLIQNMGQICNRNQQSYSDVAENQPDRQSMQSGISKSKMEGKVRPDGQTRNCVNPKTYQKSNTQTLGSMKTSQTEPDEEGKHQGSKDQYTTQQNIPSSKQFQGNTNTDRASVTRCKGQNQINNTNRSTFSSNFTSQIKSTYGVDTSKFSNSNKHRSAVRQQNKSVARNKPAGSTCTQKTPIVMSKGVPSNTDRTQGSSGQANKPVQKQVKETSAMLLPSEKEKFGDRCPAGFKKIDLLGKGGIALVWLAEIKSKKKYGTELEGSRVALKQFPKIKGQPIDNSARIEIEIGNTLFPLQVKDGCEGENDDEFERTYAVDPSLHPGMKSIARLIDQLEDRNDFWLVYEVGSHCLSKHLCDVRGEFFRGERIYNVSHQQFYKSLARDKRILRTLIRKISETFDVLSRFSIVHSDIKPDNILIKLTEDETDIESIKLIDFGSAFSFESVQTITATTPEYLAPEILDYLELRNKNQKCGAAAVSLNHNCQPWSFDVWSLGVILLEIVTGFPVWMSLKCRVSAINGKSILGSGIFGVQGREGKRILGKQQAALKNMNSTLRKYECYGLDQDQDFIDLLERMLDFDAKRRISPLEIINHNFVTNEHN